MEVNRLELRDVLSSIMEDSGEEPHLYFQPPETIKLEYPCMVYHLKTLTSRKANDKPYHKIIGFDITYITRSPASSVPSRMLSEQYMNFDRYYTSENLHHYAYTYSNTLKEVSHD
jgi:hypothetical protein